MKKIIVVIIGCNGSTITSSTSTSTSGGMITSIIPARGLRRDG